MDTEIRKLLEKRVIAVADPSHTQEFLSRVFLVPKKDGSQRPVINLCLVEHLIQEGVGWQK